MVRHVAVWRLYRIHHCCRELLKRSLTVNTPNLSRPIALVTGAGKRIGRAMALALAANGFNIGIHYRNSAGDASDLKKVIELKGANAEIFRADLSQEYDTQSLIENVNQRLGPVSLLVNSASVFEDDDLFTMTRKSWDLHIETNLRAPLKLSQEFAAQIPAGENNLIVNVTDQRVLKLTPKFLSYSLSKSALHTLTTILAQALGPQGIRVNAIAPGPTIRNERQSEDDWKKQNAATILGAGADPSDICEALLYLAKAKSVTGQTIAVDGGQRLAWRTADALVKE
ncbi:MAG: SDR family oxidoreductase [Marinicaulis sp.]|nr:SDR family oxidoreductase [Marinicaulis sp.]